MILVGYRKFCSLALGLCLLGSSCAGQSPAATQSLLPAQPSLYYKQIIIGAQNLNVEVVTSSADMEQGLSGREAMADSQGMLFNFATATTQAFWMKDMKFNLDFIWVAGGKIIGITSNVPAPNAKCQMPNIKCELPLYGPPAPVDMVLEVNAGWADAHKIKTGDVVRF